MDAVNALDLRQSLGRVLRRLERDGAPILVKRGQKPAAVLISLRDYQQRFVDREADEQRRAVVARLGKVRVATPRGKTTLDLLRELRAGSS
jgi:prevent-host-death family protein